MLICYVDCLLEGTCVTGECQILFEPPGFECLCHSGNYGRHCELYDPCVLTPCQNGATCRNFVNGTYECQCLEGFEGENCIVPVGPACLHEEPCLNNGTCSKWITIFFLCSSLKRVFWLNVNNKQKLSILEMDAIVFRAMKAPNAKVSILVGMTHAPKRQIAPFC